jgi:hypothetical protein
MPIKLEDAAIASNSEIDKVAREFGAFDAAEVTTMSQWIQMKRASVLQQIHKTRSELQRLDQSLVRLQALVSSDFGRKGSAARFHSECNALEGWSLTFVANYIALASLDDRMNSQNRYVGMIDYTRGAIQLATTQQPGAAMIFQKPVLNRLTDLRVIYGDP